MGLLRPGHRGTLRLLLGSSSVAALLIGGGAPSAFAQCATSITGTQPGCTNSATITGINIHSATVTGNINNTGVISPSGISVNTGSTINGAIVDSGTIAGGIKIDATSQLSATGTGIQITGPFAGGISNAGTVSSLASGIHVQGAPTFSGGIVNATGGTISAGVEGISIENVSFFVGAITNAGKILSAQNGIRLSTVGIFGSTSAGGGIVNSGTISAGNGSFGGTGIFLNKVVTFQGGITNSGTVSATNIGVQIATSTFSGGVTNGGTITSGATGINVFLAQTFSGGVDNSTTISAGGKGIRVGFSIFGSYGVSNFSGGITNSGAITAGPTGIAVNGVSTMSGGITNSGTISASGTNGNAIVVTKVTTFSGGITNSGTISGGAAAITIAGVSTFSGNVSNAGTVTGNAGIVIGSGAGFAAGSAIVNSGNITGAGGTAIDVSAATSPVTIDQAGGSISGAIRLSANADVLTIGGGTIAGNIVGAGASNTVNFALGSSGTFTYGNDFTGIHQVNVNSGTVILNGNDSATALAVNNGGALEGTATITGNVSINTGGTFAPGAPGTPGTSMTIVGNLAFQSGALYFVQLNPSTATLAVAGTANLGGNVLAAFAPGSYLAKQYDILHAGGLSGSFALLGTTNLPAGFTASLSYNATDAFLDLTATMGGLPNSGLSGNQQNVANALNNFFNSGGTLTPNFLTIFGLTGGNLANALSLLSGEAAADGDKAAFQMMTQFMGFMLDPTLDGRSGGAGGGGANGFAPEQQPSFPPDLALAYNSVLKAPPSFEQRWSAWGAGFGGYNKTSGNPMVGSHDVAARTYGFAAGMDYRVTPDTVAGFALAGGGTNWGLAQGLGGGRSEAFQVGVYGRTRSGPAYLAGALAFADHFMSTDRTAVAGDRLTADFNAQSYAARVEAGYRVRVPALSITPYAALQAQRFHTPSYSETDVTGGGFGLAFNAMSATDTRGEVGARFDTLQMLAGMPLMLRARLAWAHDWVTNPALGAVFQSLPGASFTVNGAAPAKDSALASAGAELRLGNAWSLAAKFDGEFASGSQTYAGTGTLLKRW